MTLLYVETKSAYNFTVEQAEHDTVGPIDFMHRFIRMCEDEGGYYHEEDKTFFPWHSILRVTIKESK